MEPPTPNNRNAVSGSFLFADYKKTFPEIEVSRIKTFRHFVREGKTKTKTNPKKNFDLKPPPIPNSMSLSCPQPRTSFHPNAITSAIETAASHQKWRTSFEKMCKTCFMIRSSLTIVVRPLP